MANLSINKILEQITNICKKYQVEHLYLFGSYATGTATETSDIDIVIHGCSDFFSLSEEIERIPTLKRIDIFNYDTCSNPHLKEDMDQYGKKIY